MNALNLYLKQDNQLGGPRWSRTGNQGNQWIRGELKIDLKTDYQIVFEGVTSGFAQGLIAIDDIRVLPSCPPKLDRFCDFEDEDICNYKNLNTSTTLWKRGSRNTLNSGPQIDQYAFLLLIFFK